MTSTFSPYLPQLFSKTPREGYLTIEFDEGKSNLYISRDAAEKVESLRASLDFPNTSSAPHKFSSPMGCSPDLFAALFGIASENKNINEVLIPAQKQDPRIFEILHNCLSILYPAKYLDISKSLLTQFSTMDLENAYALMNTPTDKISYAQVLARKRIKSAIYFATKEEANACSDQAEWAKKRHSPWGLFHASRYVNDNDSLICTEARKAQKALQTYCETITLALKNSGTDTSNTKLMEHIIGPKNYLFSHYGIVPSTLPDDPSSPFCCVPVLQQTCTTEQGLHLSDAKGLVFSLNGDVTPYKLESEIRTKILNAQGLEERPDSSLLYDRSRGVFCYLNVPLPDRLIKPDSNENLIQQVSANAPPFFEASIKSHANQAEIKLKKQKKAIYFQTSEKAQQWLDAHPNPQDFKKHKVSAWGLHYASQHFTQDFSHTHPEIQLAALKADKILKAYKEAITSELKNSKAKMDEKILKYIIGPDDFIFSRFGIVPKGSGSSRYPFCFIPSAMNTCIYEQQLHIANPYSLGYTLDDSDPEALKQEICTDISSEIDSITGQNPGFSLDKIPKG